MRLDPTYPTSQSLAQMKTKQDTQEERVDRSTKIPSKVDKCPSRTRLRVKTQRNSTDPFTGPPRSTLPSRRIARGGSTSMNRFIVETPQIPTTHHPPMKRILIANHFTSRALLIRS